MTVTAKALAEGQFAPASDTSIYTAPSSGRTIIDKFTATNTDGSARTLSINLLALGETADDSNLVISALSLSAGETKDIAEIQNHILNPGGQISIIASVAGVVSVRSSGREIT